MLYIRVSAGHSQFIACDFLNLMQMLSSHRTTMILNEVVRGHPTALGEADNNRLLN